MTAWTTDELARIGGADELNITTARNNGSLRAWVPIWVVRVDDELYVRSYRGTGGAWYRHAVQHPVGRIRAGGVERDVTFQRPDDTVRAALDNAIDEGYRVKYARYGNTYLQPMLAAQATRATLRLTPRQ